MSSLPFESFEACVCVSIPRDATVPWSHASPADEFCRSILMTIPAKLLAALKPTYYAQVQAPHLWLDGYLCLSPAVIVRTYLIPPILNEKASAASPAPGLLQATTQSQLLGMESHATASSSSSTTNPMLSEFIMRDLPMSVRPRKIEHVRSAQQYLRRMQEIRETCAAHGLEPLFHFTAPFVGSLILNGQSIPHSITDSAS